VSPIFQRILQSTYWAVPAACMFQAVLPSATSPHYSLGTSNMATLGIGWTSR